MVDFLLAAPDDLTNILGQNETIELYIKQKFYHYKINIDSVVITNKRVILRHPHALGLKKDYTDYNYIDFENVTIEQGLMRSTIKCTFKTQTAPLVLNDVPKADADKVYKIIRDNINKAQTAAPTEATTPGMTICSYCGTKNQPDASKCINCGANIAQTQQTNLVFCPAVSLARCSAESKLVLVSSSDCLFPHQGLDSTPLFR